MKPLLRLRCNLPTTRCPTRAFPRPLLLAGLLAAALPVAAQPSVALDRFSLSVGAWHADPRLALGIDTPFGRLDSGAVRSAQGGVPRLSANLLLGDRHGLALDAFRVRRGYERSVAGSDRVGSRTVTTRGAINLDVRLDYAKLSYRRWAGTGNTVLGVGAGAAHYQAEISARGAAAINGATASFSESWRDSALAPLLEIDLRHAITPDLRLFADLSGVRRGGGRSQGSIYNAAVGVEWFPTRNVGLTLDYATTRIELERKGTVYAQLRTRFQGPSAALKVRF